MKTSLALVMLLLVELVVSNASAAGLRSSNSNSNNKQTRRNLQKCKDSTEKFMLHQTGNTYKNRSCAYIQKNLNRCNKKLEDGSGKGNDMCPVTCNTCPEEKCKDTTEKFMLHQTGSTYKNRSCAYIQKNLNRCNKELEDGSGKGNDMCPVTCSNCPGDDDEETEVPPPKTQNPTASPTASPTAKPTEAEQEAKKTIVYRDPVTTCFDYSQVVLDVGQKECTWWYIFQHIHTTYKEQDALEETPRCEDGFWNEIRRLTDTVGTTGEEWKPALEELCDQALYDDAVDEVQTVNWGRVENANINLEEFFNGDGFMNTDYGNLQQITLGFEVRGGYDRYHYIGEDPTLNDYLPTPQRSVDGGKAILDLYERDLSNRFLSSPSFSKMEGGCPATNAAVCCWSRDRQYHDNSGNCNSQGLCRNGNPGDNTDLCWTTDSNDGIFPYPTQETEGPMHCHGYSWSDGDFSETTQHNNLFFVSMYDHLYKRGYVQSITQNEFQPIEGDSVPMCGCVEDMPAVARADCTEIVPRANYTAYQNEDGYFVVEHKKGTFELEYNACEGYKYNPDVSPKAYAENPNANEQGLQRQNNDLSAYVFRQYLEGKKELEETEAFEETIIGYKDPEVNKGDNEREVACKKAFKAKYPGRPWEGPVKEEKEE